MCSMFSMDSSNSFKVMTREEELKLGSYQAYPSNVEYSFVGNRLKDYNAEQRQIWLAGAKWADKTMIERACQFFWSLSLEKMDEYFSSSENLCQFTDDFKKAMEE